MATGRRFISHSTLLATFVPSRYLTCPYYDTKMSLDKVCSFAVTDCNAFIRHLRSPSCYRVCSLPSRRQPKESTREATYS